VALLQPGDDRVKNHGEEKYEREEQDHRLKRPQNQPNDDEQKDEPDNPPRAVITQRSVLIFVIGLFHGMPIFVLLAWNDKKTWSRGFPGSTRGRLLATASSRSRPFLLRSMTLSDYRAFLESSFRRDAETNMLALCAPQGCSCARSPSTGLCRP
jgi:hypothetical protein